MRLNSSASFVLLLMCLIALGGCAQFSADGGVGKVSDLAGLNIARVTDATSAKKIADETRLALAQELTADTAVRIALLNNQALQASLAELGISEADMVRAGRLPNPFLSFSRLSGANVEIERAIGFDFLALLTMPKRIKIERQRFLQVQQQAALQAVQLAINTRRAYFNAVAATEAAFYLQQATEATAAGAELAAEMKKAGNWSALDAMRQQALFNDALTQSELAGQARLAAIEALSQLLGQDDAAALKLPARLPDIPAALEKIENPAQLAIDQRLDVQIARTNTIALAETLGLAKSTAMVDAIRLTYQNKSATGEPLADGFGVSLMLPLFDWTHAKSRRAQEQYLQAVYRSADVAIRARSDARTAYAARKTAHALALHYRDTVVPTRKQISDETLLRYNGMLISVFELLIDARNQILAVNSAIQASRDYWLAESNWQMALHGGAIVINASPAAAPAAAMPLGH